MIAIPTFTTMILIGIWHGAGLQFAVFGLLHAVYLSINHAWRIFRPTANRRPSRALLRMVSHIASVLLTYGAVVIGMIFFRSTSIGTAGQMLAGLVGCHGLGEQFGGGRRELLWTVLLFAIVWGMPNTQQIMARYDPALEEVRPHPLPLLQWQGNLIWGIVIGIGFGIALFGMGGTSEFLYFQF
jgi:choline-glycine betaine transporter